MVVRRTTPTGAGSLGWPHVQGGDGQGPGARAGRLLPWYAVPEAERLGVRGWVRNEPDESVAAHLEGDDAAVDAMVAWCRHGPSYASVRDVAVTEARPTGAESFRIRY